MAGTKLFIVTTTFDHNLWKHKRWSTVWKYRPWLCVQDITSSGNCGRFGTGRKWLPHLWYCWMVSPLMMSPFLWVLPSCEPNRRVNLFPTLFRGRIPRFQMNRMMSLTTICRKSLKAAKIFFSFSKTCQQFFEFPPPIHVPIRTEVSGSYILNESRILSSLFTFT